jgi:hypothetical protein
MAGVGEPILPVAAGPIRDHGLAVRRIVTKVTLANLWCRP